MTAPGNAKASAATDAFARETPIETDERFTSIMTQTTDKVTPEQLDRDIATLAELKALTGDQRRVPVGSAGFDMLRRYWPSHYWGEAGDGRDQERWALLTYNDEATLRRLAKAPFETEEPAWCTIAARGLEHPHDYEEDDPDVDVTDHASDCFRVGEHVLAVSIERTDTRKHGAVTLGTPRIVVGGEVDYLDAQTAREYAWALLKASVQLDEMTGARSLAPQAEVDPLDASEPVWHRVMSGNDLVDLTFHLTDANGVWTLEHDPQGAGLDQQEARQYLTDLAAVLVAFEAIGGQEAGH